MDDELKPFSELISGTDHDELMSEMDRLRQEATPPDNTFGSTETVGQKENPKTDEYLLLQVHKMAVKAKRHPVDGSEFGVIEIYFKPAVVQERSIKTTDEGEVPNLTLVPLSDTPLMVELPAYLFSETKAKNWADITLREADAWFTSLISSARVLSNVPKPKDQLALGEAMLKYIKDNMPNG